MTKTGTPFHREQQKTHRAALAEEHRVAMEAAGKRVVNRVIEESNRGFRELQAKTQADAALVYAHTIPTMQERKESISQSELARFRMQNPELSKTQAVNRLRNIKLEGHSFFDGKQSWDGTKRAGKRVKAVLRAHHRRMQDRELRDISYNPEIPDGLGGTIKVRVSAKLKRKEEAIVQPRHVPIYKQPSSSKSKNRIPIHPHHSYWIGSIEKEKKTK